MQSPLWTAFFFVDREASIMEELRNWLLERNFSVPNLVLDGRLHRFPRDKSRDSGWIIGWIHNYIKRSGTYCVAVVGDWRTGEEHIYYPKDVGSHERKLAEQVIADGKKRIAAEKQILQRDAAEKAKERIARAKSEGSTPYLLRKKIDQLYGAVIDGNNLVVPMAIDGVVVGSQRILPDGTKYFEKGQKTSGAYHVIGAIQEQVFICEGFATGCSIHMATKKPVVVAFNANNLDIVAKEIRRTYPDIRITICGDDDRFTVIDGQPVNVGRLKADKAAMVCMGTVRFPKFMSSDHGTDFNDLHCVEGLDKVSAQLIVPPSEIAAGFRALGYDDNGHYFFNLAAKDIFRLTTFTPLQLFHLAPEQFWNENYRSGDDAKTNYKRAMDDLVAASLKKGRWDPAKVRGMGVWLDKGRVVVNTGNRLLVSGEEQPLHWSDGEAVYVQSSQKIPDFSGMASIDECRALLDALALLQFENPNSQFLLAGWIALARVAGALPIRPHVWLTGGSGTGKSTVMTRIIEPALGGSSSVMLAQGGTTEAGIRQTLRASSVPVIFDEFESVNKVTKERHESIIELLRNSWSATNGVIVKGSANGTAMGFNLTFSALVSSVGVNLLTDADRSRFSVLELQPHGDDNQQYDRLQQALGRIDRALGHRIFARIVWMLPSILESYEILRQEIARVSRQRMGQQIGMLMAGWWALQSDDVVTRQQAASIAEDLDVRQENALRQTEEMECLAHLLTSRVTFDEAGRLSQTIGEILQLDPAQHSNLGLQKELKKYGLVVEGRDIFVSDSHATLAKIYADTRWCGQWARHLKRLPGAAQVSSKTFSEKLRQRATKIPRSLI